MIKALNILIDFIMLLLIIGIPIVLGVMLGLEIAGLAEFMGESLATIQRRRTRLVRQLALMLYGAEALI